MAEDRFDDDGAPPDEHDREMADLGMAIEGEIVTEDEGEFVQVEINQDRIAAISSHLAECMNKYILPIEPLYFEIGIAVAHLYLETSTKWLGKAESLTLFQQNRDRMLYVLGNLSARVNEIEYAHLADVEVSTVVH